MQQPRFSLAELAEIVRGRLIPEANGHHTISDLLTDSRQLFRSEHTLFFALKTNRNDGHRYIAELFDKGVRSFVISDENFPVSQYPEASFILVKDSLEALQAIAAAYRKKFSIPVIGITGSNGKTIVKEWLYQLLSPSIRVVRSPKSYNSQIGVPLSVWQLEPEYQLAIFEAGISAPDEMHRLQKIIQPTYGIFTNIGEAHSENFINRYQKIGEKLKLFTHVKTLIYSPDYSELQEVIIKSGLQKSVTLFTWSKKNKADLQITRIERKLSEFTEISGIYQGKEISIEIPFVDEASVENAIHCWAMLLVLGYDNTVISERMKHLTPIAMRLELIEGINNCTLINDSYNSDIVSIGIALDFLVQHTPQKNKTVILSDVFQSGRSEHDLYREIAEMLEKKKITRLIGIGPAISRQASVFHLPQSDFYPSTEEFLANYPFSRFQNEGILLKGARLFEFERITQALQQKTHETVIEINLNSLIHNLNHYRSKLSQGTKVMAMVKAGSYGTGGIEVASALQYHKVDYLAVAYADEGVELRKAGIHLPIMIMNPDEDSVDTIINHNLEPEIYSFRVLDMLERAIRRNIISRNSPVKIHVKLDTGMHRLGFCPPDIDELMRRIINNPRIYVASIFTHLAAADDPAHDDFTRKQIDQFQQLSDRMMSFLDYPVLRHVLNTAGICRFPEAQFEMVRIGIGLYGISPIPQEQADLLNVVSLRSVISQLKTVRQGETIGYNRSETAMKDMQLAIVPVGYADGLSRRLSNGKGHLMVAGKLVPIVGKVCMDMCMVDVTGLDVKEGDEVIIFDSQRPVSQLAAEMETIPYEILTSLSRRVKRIYYLE